MTLIIFYFSFLIVVHSFKSSLFSPRSCGLNTTMCRRGLQDCTTSPVLGFKKIKQLTKQFIDEHPNKLFGGSFNSLFEAIKTAL